MQAKSILTIFVTLLFLVGCGSNMDSGGDQTGPGTTIADAENLGASNCLTCHAALTHLEFSGVAGINTNASGLANAITHDCEDCHGGGQFHFGTGEIPYPSPDGARCATCHTQATLILASKHNADDATNTSMIADGHDTGYCQRCHVGEGVYKYGVVFPVIGDKTYIEDTIVDYGDTVGGGQVEALNNEDAGGNAILHNVVCSTCHNPLTKELVTANPGVTFPAVATWDPNLSGTSDEFDLCTFCHNYYMNDGTTLFGSGENGTAEFYHNNTWYRNITTTHFDDPTTAPSVAVEGYVIRKDSAHPCWDCHGHELKTNSGDADDPAEATIHTMWARSGHAGGLLNEVLDAVDAVDCSSSPSLSRGKCNEQVNAAMAAGASDASSGGGFTHYDWDDTGGWGGNARGSCQQCHTATGFMNYATDPTTYVPANNDFSHLSGWVDGVSSSPQNELLYCWACHSNAESGALRNPGAITPGYLDDDGVTATVLPDINSSNVCISCHIGRESGGEIKALTGDFTSQSFINSHYLAAGGTLFRTTGYEYTGMDYEDVSYFHHNDIGMGTNADLAAFEAANGLGGPCVGCHMSASDSHLFQVVEKDSTGVITSITATICINCHDGEHGTAFVAKGGDATAVAAAATFMEEEVEDYAAALNGLAAQMAVLGHPYSTGYPYFATGNWNNWGAGTGANLMGAAFNFNLLLHDPGGYAHDRFYAKRLIYDSIDFADDGLLNNTTGATLTALGAANQATYGADTFTAAEATAANTYLDGNTSTAGVQRP